MEYTGFEPVASTMRMWRAPSCANTPELIWSGKPDAPVLRWKQRGSNPWPPASQASALPAELCFRAVCAASLLLIWVLYLCKRQQPAASGPGGNRTRVQKPVPCTSTIIVSSFSFPLPHGNGHPCGFSSFMIRLTAQSFAVIVSHMFDAGSLRCECPGADMRQLGRS